MWTHGFVTLTECSTQTTISKPEDFQTWSQRMIPAHLSDHHSTTWEAKVSFYRTILLLQIDLHSLIVVELMAVCVCSGSTRLVRVGSRSFPVYPLVIVCLVLLNVILLLTAVVLGVNCKYN